MKITGRLKKPFKLNGVNLWKLGEGHKAYNSESRRATIQIFFLFFSKEILKAALFNEKKAKKTECSKIVFWEGE